MSKINIKEIVDRTFKTLSEHSPEILTGLGIAGMATAVVLAVKATPKAMEAIDYIEIPEEAEKPTGGQVIKATWKYYVPAAVTFVASTGCILGANTVNGRRNAALAAAYELSQNALIEYKGKVNEIIGDKKEKKIRDAIVEDHINNNPPSNNEVFITTKDGVLCYDNNSGRYFKIDPAELDRIENELNYIMINNMYVSLNDFYERVGLPYTTLGNQLGWNVDSGMVHFEKHYIGAEDGTPCIGISFNVEPRYDYTKLS